MRKSIPVLALTLLLCACSEPEPVVVVEDDEAGDFANDNERVLYAIGIALGTQLTDFALSEAEIEFVAAGISDAATEAPPKVDMNVYGPQIQQFVEERTRASREEEFARQAEELAQEKSSAAAFADQIAAEPGAERSVSGLVYVPITVGTGANPDARDTVSVHYHGTFRDGSVFDSSVERGEPATFPLSGVIPCWTEGVQKIRVGGKAKLLCPAEIAYGDEGRPGIPGGAALLFEVELLAIE